MKLKDNKIPSHSVSLENIFTHHDAYIQRKRKERDKYFREHEGLNIGDGLKPKMINIGKCCTMGEREEAKDLLQKYQDVFNWSYEDTKNFVGGKFKHKIPLKLDAMPFH